MCPGLYSGPAVRDAYGETRRDRRYRVQIPVTLWNGRERVEIMTGDVSLRGMFLCTDRGLRPKQFVRLDLVLPFGGGPVSLFCSVVHTVVPGGDNGAKPGSGVELYGNGPDALKKWAAFVRVVAQRYPQASEIEVRLAVA